VPNSTEHEISRWARLSLPLLAVLAAAISAYLLFVALASKGLPVGCGDDSGCAEVLTSRWSVIAGIPVSAPALIVYLTVFAVSLLPSRPPTRSLLMLIAIVLMYSAVWFVALQLIILKAICPWCMVEHGLGFAMALVILTGYRPRAAPEQAATSRRAMLSTVTLATIGFGLFATAQMFSSPPSTTQRLPEGTNVDTGPGANRRISVLQGKLQLTAHEEPVLGSADASKLLCLMFDYCCPHCRRTHAYLRTALDEFSGELAIVSLPMPRDADCNPTIEQTDERFENSCELARLALAVWLTDPTAFAEFDQWLFESSKPRSVDDARARAEQLVPAEQLQSSLEDRSIDERIARNIQAYEASDAQYIPILMSPGFDAVVGRPESEEALLAMLRNELFVEPRKVE
jgi:uncharacterized membrane protein